MMTSVKISEITRASSTVSGRLQTITPPNGAWRSVSNAFCHATFRLSSS